MILDFFGTGPGRYLNLGASVVAVIATRGGRDHGNHRVSPHQQAAAGP